MTQGDDVAQSPGPTKPKDGWPARVWHLLERWQRRVSNVGKAVLPQSLAARPDKWASQAPISAKALT
jgi:hypothetical protein